MNPKIENRSIRNQNCRCKRLRTLEAENAWLRAQLEKHNIPTEPESVIEGEQNGKQEPVS